MKKFILLSALSAISVAWGCPAGYSSFQVNFHFTDGVTLENVMLLDDSGANDNPSEISMAGTNALTICNKGDVSIPGNSGTLPFHYGVWAEESNVDLYRYKGDPQTLKSWTYFRLSLNYVGSTNTCDVGIGQRTDGSLDFQSDFRNPTPEHAMVADNAFTYFYQGVPFFAHNYFNHPLRTVIQCKVETRLPDNSIRIHWNDFEITPVDNQTFKIGTVKNSYDELNITNVSNNYVYNNITNLDFVESVNAFGNKTPFKEEYGTANLTSLLATKSGPIPIDSNTNQYSVTITNSWFELGIDPNTPTPINDLIKANYIPSSTPIKKATAAAVVDLKANYNSTPTRCDNLLIMSLGNDLGWAIMQYGNPNILKTDGTGSSLQLNCYNANNPAQKITNLMLRDDSMWPIDEIAITAN